MWDSDTRHVYASLTHGLLPSLHQRINYYNTDRCVTSQVVGETKKEEKMQNVNRSGVLCVCVMARWKMSLCDVSEGKHASRGRSLVPPRSLHSNTPGLSLWCAPCWEHKQSRGRQAVNDKSQALGSQIIILLVIFTSLITPQLAQNSSQQRNFHPNDSFNLVTRPKIVLLHLKQLQIEPMNGLISLLFKCKSACYSTWMKWH